MRLCDSGQYVLSLSTAGLVVLMSVLMIPASLFGAHRTFHLTSDLSPDGKIIVHSEAKGLLRLSSLNNGRQMQEYQLPSGEYNSLRFSPGGTRVLRVVFSNSVDEPFEWSKPVNGNAFE